LEKKNQKKKTGKRAKWTNQQSEKNLKTSFTLSLSLFSFALHIQSLTLTRPPPPTVLVRPPRLSHTPSPPEKLQTPVHNHRLSLSAWKSPFTKSMKILEYF
jgi:hypothetical protein